MNDRLFSDEIRERMRKRRRKDLLWSVASFFLHVVLFGAIILLTPAKSLVFDEKKEIKDAAKDLSADRIEQIADSLSQARINELLRQLEALQAVLHNMDLMKEELQSDYDAFVGKNSEDMKVTLGKLLDDAERAQKEAQENQSPMIDQVGRMLAEERLDLRDEERSKWLRENAEQLITVAGDKVSDAQARAGNSLDQVQVKAQFGGYRKTAEASEKVRDAQIEAATMQNQAQKEASEIGWRMSSYRGKARDLEHHEKSLAEQRERLAKAEQEKKDAEAKLAEATNLRDQAERERDAAQAQERANRDEANRRNAEAKLAKSESNRLGSELKKMRRQLEEAKKARDKAARAAAERAKKEGRS